MSFRWNTEGVLRKIGAIKLFDSSLVNRQLFLSQPRNESMTNGH
jgi:hypothetical protein